MSLTFEQISQARAAHAELQEARFLVQNAGLDGNAVRVDRAAYHRAAQTVLWPLLERLKPLFETVALIVAAEAERLSTDKRGKRLQKRSGRVRARRASRKRFCKALARECKGIASESAGRIAAFLSRTTRIAWNVRQLMANREAVDTFMRQGWQASLGAGRAMEHTFRYAGELAPRG